MSLTVVVRTNRPLCRALPCAAPEVDCRRGSSRFALAVGGVAWRMERNAKIRWAQHQALPEIIKLAGADKFDNAYRLAQQAQPYIPDDPLLAEQLRMISRRAIIVTDPPGAEVFYRPYGRRERAVAAAR